MYNAEKSFNTYMEKIGSSILFSNSPGSTIKNVRKDVEVTQEKMAELLEVRRETLSRIETGVINPTSSFIKNFSKMVSIVKVFRDLNAIRDGSGTGGEALINPTFIKTHFSFTNDELDSLTQIGNDSYSKTKKKILRRIKI